MLLSLQFTSCPHDPCLYRGVIDGETSLSLRQIDDFAIASASPVAANKLMDKLDSNLKQPLKRQILLSSFNGINVE